MFIIFKAKSEDWSEAKLQDENFGAEARHLDLRAIEDFSLLETVVRESPLIKELDSKSQEVYEMCPGLLAPQPSIEEVIQTYMSSFVYASLGFGLFIYKGARNGFLKQELLPFFEDVEILYVEGSYGKFVGPEALERYEESKEKMSTPRPYGA